MIQTQFLKELKHAVRCSLKAFLSSGQTIRLAKHRPILVTKF